MNKSGTDKSDRVLIIGKTKDETRRLANALVSGYGTSAARSVQDAAGRLKNEIDYLRRQQDVVYDYDRVIAVSPVMQNVLISNYPRHLMWVSFLVCTLFLRVLMWKIISQ